MCGLWCASEPSATGLLDKYLSTLVHVAEVLNSTSVRQCRFCSSEQTTGGVADLELPLGHQLITSGGPSLSRYHTKASKRFVFDPVSHDDGIRWTVCTRICLHCPRSRGIGVGGGITQYLLEDPALGLFFMGAALDATVG